MNVRTMAAELVASALRDPKVLEELAGQSYRNYHASGLDYVCLLRDDRLTVKAYLFDPGRLAPGEPVVHVHNHRFAFEHVTLRGTVVNHRFALADRAADGGPAVPVDLYAYQAEDRKPTLVGSARMVEVEAEPTGPAQRFDRFAMSDPSELHTISVEYVHDGCDGPKLPMVAVQLQYHDRRAMSLMACPQGVVPRCDGELLYLPMAPHVVRRHLETLKEVL